MQSHLNRWRMAVHGLDKPRFDDFHEAVSFFGAVQCQNIGPAIWGMAQRVTAATAADLAVSLHNGRVVRTHVLRPTWHYVAAEDLRAWLALTGPRVLVQAGSQMRSLKLDSDELVRCHRVIAAALAGRALSRPQIGEALTAGGIDNGGVRLAAIVMHAELTGLVCSAGGPKQPNYALIDERIPMQPATDRDEALADLTVRYFTSHGPATVNDFRWWSSLTITDIKRALAMLGDDLQQFERDGRTYWAGEPAPTQALRSTIVNIVGIYDEYLVGYRESRDVSYPDGGDETPGYVRGLPLGVLLVDGAAIGRWRVRRSGSTIDLETHLVRALTGDEARELREVATGYAAFHGWSLRDIETVIHR